MVRISIGIRKSDEDKIEKLNKAIMSCIFRIVYEICLSPNLSYLNNEMIRWECSRLRELLIEKRKILEGGSS